MKQDKAIPPPGLFRVAKGSRPAPINIGAIRAALQEDAPDGDLASTLTIPQTARARAVLKAKQDFTAAGTEVFAAVFRQVDSGLKVSLKVRDGVVVRKGEIMARVIGSARSILMAERVALNYLIRLSAIATLTASYVEAVRRSGCLILDTRKTTPGLRALEKYAVLVGGGANHRNDLSQMALIKENHIAVAGGVMDAIAMAKRGLGPDGYFAIEVTNIQELKEALDGGAPHILLDNMSPAMMKQAVKTAAGRVWLEASGNMTLARAAQAAKAGVDFVSVGALTHSAPGVDVSLMVEVLKK